MPLADAIGRASPAGPRLQKAPGAAHSRRQLARHPARDRYDVWLCQRPGPHIGRPHRRDRTRALIVAALTRDEVAAHALRNLRPAEPARCYEYHPLGRRWRFRHRAARGVPGRPPPGPERDRRVWAWMTKDGKTPAEIAALLGLTRSRGHVLCRQVTQRARLQGSPTPARVPDALSLWDVGLRPALRSALLRAGLATVGDTRGRRDTELLALPGVGAQGVAELRAACGPLSSAR